MDAGDAMTAPLPCQDGCPKCGHPGPTLVFRSRVVSLRACWRCLSRLVADARAADVEYTVG